ncbi:MAG: dTMP kinase [Verrucomicrobia bacterium]|nr:MAG: dTMP kinase [Verrucomicrobiota bacterium]
MSENNQKPGLLISFEGAEGSGKTTQIEMLVPKIEALGRDVVVTREPGGSAIGEEIRHLLIRTNGSEEMFPETELLLFAASRAQLVREVLVPNLKAGKIVLCDRFLDSTTVYQGVARSLAQDPVEQINKFAVGDVTPDLTFILDVPAEVSIKRVKHRATDLPDRIEQENIDFYRIVREGYLWLAKSMPERFHVIDATKSPAKVHQEVWKTVKKLLKAVEEPVQS